MPVSKRKFRELKPRPVYLLKMVEIKKITVFAKIIRGPAGKPENSETKIPKNEDVIPMTIATKAYWNKF